MASLEHFASRSADYGEVLDYVMYRHKDGGGPVLSPEGSPVYRKEFYLDGVLCHPGSFPTECLWTNFRYGKNTRPEEVRRHHYLISFSARDRDVYGLTGRWAQELAVEFVKLNFPGFQAVVCTHTDGEQHRDNIHSHIYINSVRKEDAPERAYAELPSDRLAGHKHRSTRGFFRHLMESLRDLCRRDGLSYPDLETPAAERHSYREYQALVYGQRKLDEVSRQLVLQGAAPQTARYRTDLQRIRNAIAETSSYVYSTEEFKKELRERYGILLQDHRGYWAYRFPDSEKFVTGIHLGADYLKETLEERFFDNRLRSAERSPPLPEEEKQRLNFIRTVLSMKTDSGLARSLQKTLTRYRNIWEVPDKLVASLGAVSDTILFAEKNGFDSADNLYWEIGYLQDLAVDTEDDIARMEEKLKNLREDEELMLESNPLLPDVRSRIRRINDTLPIRRQSLHELEAAIAEDKRHYREIRNIESPYFGRNAILPERKPRAFLPKPPEPEIIEPVKPPPKKKKRSYDMER